MSEAWVQVAIGVIVGGCITYWAAHRYYVRASKDLEIQAKRLRSSSELVLKWLDLVAKGVDTDLKYDSDGNIVGIFANLQAKLTGSGDLKANHGNEKNE